MKMYLNNFIYKLCVVQSIGDFSAVCQLGKYVTSNKMFTKPVINCHPNCQSDGKMGRNVLS
jgi:hypothetical protein